MLTGFIAFIFRFAGWKTAGTRTNSVPKAIWIVAPHTTNRDFFVGLGTRADLKMNIGFLAKSELFRWYSGWFFHGLGGYPVYRKTANNLVDAVVGTFRENERINIAIAPEGTRKDVSRIKTGFYFMALGADVPLILVCFNHSSKTVTISDPLYLSGNYLADMKQVYDFYVKFSDRKKTWLLDYERTGNIPNLPPAVS